jgi:hypothetical protein
VNARLARLRRLRDDEARLGIVEIMVTIVILAIVMTLITGMFMSTSRVVATGTSINTSTKAASLGLNELSKALRFAASNPVSGHALDDPAFVVAKSDLLTVTSYIDVDAADPRPTKLAFTIDAQGRLIEVRYDSYEVSSGFWAFKSTPASSRILTGALIPATGSEPPLFTYLDSNNAPLTMPGTGLTSAQLPLVAAVQIYFKLKSDDASSGNPVAFQSVVGIPNLGIKRTGQ